MFHCTSTVRPFLNLPSEPTVLPIFPRILQIKFWFWPCIRPTFPLWKFQQIHLNISALTFSLSGRKNISKNVKQIPYENMGDFLASNKAESWSFDFMGWLSLGQTGNETQIRPSSCMKYKGKNFKLFAWQHACKPEKKSCFLYIHAQKHYCQDLITGTKPCDCSQDLFTLRTE